jgi:hypothetical protein
MGAIKLQVCFFSFKLVFLKDALKVHLLNDFKVK